VVHHVSLQLLNLMALIVSMLSQIPSGLPRHLEAAVNRYGSATYKATCMTVLDQTGKLTSTLLYGQSKLNI
jgi:hypothetical protein